ncbi:MAG: hypothetical protein QHJ82_08750 [Verrucomicrobiota bacterium]|nr:hypothetical protein [Verrucomicrobiota bacterium]
MKILKQFIGRLVAVVFLCGVTSGFCTTNLILLQPAVFQDGSIQLKWQSETGAIYSVESAGVLSDEGTPFIIRDDRLVSQGAVTTWLDYGDAANYPRILHPSDRPHRFYRVRKVDQSTNAPVSVSILQPTNSTVFGDITVEVSVNTTNAVGLMRLFVDGQPVDYEFGVDTFEFSINTTEWINGPHVIHATAGFLGQSGTTGEPEVEQPEVGASAPLTLEFDNLIHDFTVVTPYFDPYDPFFPEIQVVYAALAEPCDWTVDIVDNEDNWMTGFAGSGSSIYVEWDGTDFWDNPLPPGFYDYILTATKQGQFAMMSGGSSTAELGSRKTETRLTTSPQLIADRGERAEQIIKLNQIRKTGAGDELRGLRPPESPEVSETPADSVNRRVPWFMRPKPDETLSEEDWSAPIIPPIPPLPFVDWDVKPANWEAIVEDYTRMSNNIVASAYEAAAQRALVRAELAEIRSLEVQPENSGGDNPQPLYAQSSQTTRDPRRETGRTQMSWFGSVGTMSQGHHPKTNQAAWSYGPLQKANVIAKYFVQQMEKGHAQTGFPAWKKTFMLTDDQVRKTNVVGTGYSNGNIITSNSWFNSRANLGLLVGHTVEYNPPGWPAGTFGPLAAYPLYNSSNPGGYTWIPDGEMRFGSPYLKWMGYYGCNVLTRSRWFGGAKDRFVWPLNPSLNLYLATGSTIYMYDEMGRLWAKGMQGHFTGVTMTIVGAWVEAGRRTHAEVAKEKQIGPIRMSYLYWDARQEGGAYTIQDKLHPFQANFSLAGRSAENLHFDDPVVYSP